jgi:4-deoxy-L-threo-5-hexosulose-uronate ketol-isomerase
MIEPLDVRYATHPLDFKNYNSEQLRKHFVIESLFENDRVKATYSHYDRLIVGGAKPVTASVKLETFDELKSEYFLERRELGIINVGDTGTITVDGVPYELGNKEALYIGRGAQHVRFERKGEKQPLFYFNSAPAHAPCPITLISQKDADVVELGSPETANHRVIRKLIVAGKVKTCQLQMGLTELKTGSVWNTMPPHTHDRRMEAYFYFDLKPDQSVLHMMGEPSETRPLWVQNHQAIISPPWSIHCGAGTSNYAFIWGMAGENLDYTDMDVVNPTQLR